eukprot:757381-Hanusia_phi.AAC.2
MQWRTSARLAGQDATPDQLPVALPGAKRQEKGEAELWQEAELQHRAGCRRFWLNMRAAPEQHFRTGGEAGHKGDGQVQANSSAVDA